MYVGGSIQRILSPICNCLYAVTLRRHVGSLPGDVPRGRGHLLSAGASASPGTYRRRGRGPRSSSPSAKGVNGMYVCMYVCATTKGAQFRAAGEEDGLELPAHPADHIRQRPRAPRKQVRPLLMPRCTRTRTGASHVCLCLWWLG